MTDKASIVGRCLFLLVAMIIVIRLVHVYSEIERDRYVLTVIRKCVSQAAAKTRVESPKPVSIELGNVIREEFKINVDACLIDEGNQRKGIRGNGSRQW